MTISARTPEDTPSRCPLCGHATNIEFSRPADDATCPNCACLLWRATDTLERLRERIFEVGARGLSVTADTPLPQLGNDSIDAVEMIMDLEEEFAIRLSDEEAVQMKTVGDVIRLIDRHRASP